MKLKLFNYSAPDLKQINAILSVKAKANRGKWNRFEQMFKTKLPGIFIRMFPAIRVVVSPTSVRSLLICLRALKAILLKNKLRGLVIYLKVCSVCTQQAIGGHVVPDVGLLGMRISRTNAGIPRIIPVYHRKLIQNGNTNIIRLYLTIFALYRVLTIPAKVKIKSITDPFSGFDAHVIDGHIGQFVKLFVNPSFRVHSFGAMMKRFAKIFVIRKSSPGASGPDGNNPFSSHPATIILTGRALINSHLHEAFLYFMKYTNNKALLNIYNIVKEVKVMDDYTSYLYKPVTHLGKLALKHEAAGKMRIFAMVDPFTQWALYPLHKTLMRIISRYRMDGTFNQVKPLAHMVKCSSLYSLDLSSATDRLPVSLQKSLLAAISGSEEFARCWAGLLVDRTYSVPKAAKLPFREVSYAVGQPMGAYSSWAMLALTHHFIVQSAAWRAGFPTSKLYTNYALLGDDLVLGDKSVMIQYLHILRNLGVECGLHKSVISHNGTSLEFAKRTVLKGVDVSPISLSEFSAANAGVSDIVGFKTKYNLSLAQVAHTLGYGWRVKSSTNKPIGKLNSALRSIVVASIVPLDISSVHKLFSLGHGKLSPSVAIIVGQFIKIEYERLLQIAQKLTGGSGPGTIYNIDWTPFQKTPHPFGQFQDAFTEIMSDMFRPIILANHKLAQILTPKFKDPEWYGQSYGMDNTSLGPVYLLYLKFLRVVSGVSIDSVSLKRDNVPSIRGVSPLQVRLWNRWSHVLQGISKESQLLISNNASETLVKPKVSHANVRFVRGGSSKAPKVNVTK